MLGIASTGLIDKESLLRMMGTAKNGPTRVVDGQWAVASGMVAFETQEVSVVGDADIYNVTELRGLVGRTPGNVAEIIALLYLRYGIELLSKLRGLFSLCLIDKKDQKMLIATDRFGVKPVFYYDDGRNVVFGPRIGTVLSSGHAGAEELNYGALVDYMNLSAIPTPDTIYKDVKKLPPGHYLEVRKGEAGAMIREYYDIRYAKKNPVRGHRLGHLPAAIENSVRTVMEYELARGNRVGAFLSGGTDSSTIAGMMSNLDGRAKTFSIGFGEEGYDELHYARVAARHFSTEHHEYTVVPEDVIGALDVILDAYDEPFGNASAVPTYLCARLAKRHGVDTLVAGDGGDEIFGGNERYALHNTLDLYHKMRPLLMRGIVETVVFALPGFLPLVERGRRYINRASIPNPDRFFSYNPVMALGREWIFSPDLLQEIHDYDPLAWARKLYEESDAEDELERLLYIDMKFTITDNDLRKVTGMSEKAGVRTCYPMLDHTLVDYAATLPASLKVKGTRLRYAFKKSLDGFLPREIIRKKKHGFGLPIGRWIRTKSAVRSMARDCLLHPGCRVKPYFRPGFMEQLFTMHERAGISFYGDIIWLLLILELWMQKYRRS